MLSNDHGTAMTSVTSRKRALNLFRLKHLYQLSQYCEYQCMTTRILFPLLILQQQFMFYRQLFYYSFIGIFVIKGYIHLAMTLRNASLLCSVEFQPHKKLTFADTCSFRGAIVYSCILTLTLTLNLSLSLPLNTRHNPNPKQFDHHP